MPGMFHMEHPGQNHLKKEITKKICQNSLQIPADMV